jgi:hypothetical protein
VSRLTDAVASGRYPPQIIVRDVQGALALLARLGAPVRLLRHHELVAEAAREIVEGLDEFRGAFDPGTVVVGAALHDAGKVTHPDEMHGPGHRHEEEGRRMLEEQGLGDLARFCVTHARFDDPELPLDDLLVALADKLWKGKRFDALERRIVERLAAGAGRPFWDVFAVADDLFERIAAGGDRRLARSLDG